MDTRGTFIVIEGSDGSGKTTQFQRVKQRLETAGYAVEAFDFPQYEQPSSYFVKRYLQGNYGGVNDVGPYTTSLFYALDRFEAAPQIRKALTEGKIVICNRYTGSSMAHQGTKIANAEQRRGFFIWLDNLEFEMLGIPRPNISFILRVPADISQGLQANKPNRDIHETDLTHLARTVSVFDDMSQLFPKDFQRIDCVRSGKLLDVETVHSMLWEKIAPILPPPPAVRPQPAPAPPPPIVMEPIQPKPEPQPSLQHLTLTDASGLLVQRIQRLIRGTTVEYADIPAIFVPKNLVPAAQKIYETKTAELVRQYAKLHVGLAKKGKDDVGAKQTAQLVLPVGLSATVHIPASDPGLELLVLHLINDRLSELQAAGAELFAQMIKHVPDRFKDATQPAKQTIPATIAQIADEFLAQNHIGDQPSAQLVSVWPRNENDLVADMLYAYTSLPLRTIQERLNSWPMSRKLDIFEAYTKNGQLNAVLEKAHYSWDLLASYVTFCELQSYPSEALQIQPLTPRYGFAVPQSIEDAGLSDIFEQCFDLSLVLHSELQRAGHPLEAQYATLHGHNQRWTLTQSAAQFVRVRQINGLRPETQQLLTDMHSKLAETHPAIGEIPAVVPPAATQSSARL